MTHAKGVYSRTYRATSEAHRNHWEQTMSSTTHKPVVVISGEGFSYCRLCGTPINRATARNGRSVVTHANTAERFPILGDDLRPVADKPFTVEQISMEQIEAGDEISVQGGTPGSFFTVKTVRDGMAKGRGFRTTEGEYTSLPWGYAVARKVRG